MADILGFKAWNSGFTYSPEGELSKDERELRAELLTSEGEMDTPINPEEWEEIKNRVNQILTLTIEKQTAWLKLKIPELKGLVLIVENLVKELEREGIIFEKPEIPKIGDSLLLMMLTYDKKHMELIGIIENLKSLKGKNNNDQ